MKNVNRGVWPYRWHLEAGIAVYSQGYTISCKLNANCHL